MDFKWALFGGVLIGLSSVLLLVILGRVAGISGIVSGMFYPSAHSPASPKLDRWWRIAFVVGLVVGGCVTTDVMSIEIHAPTLSYGGLALAGILVGVGTVLGSGCTSGHGVCGLGRLSRRSLVAVLTFMAAGMLTVTLMNF
ncbi:YeeE/YedE family protein [Hydromonas duriensis]|uniref:Uncharacterized protein n=1 Tax=Hydromonas duriensis TaxID=1527608 RepID=A0A4R6Y1D5_9BURK|nr:YeeE/YedE thiosulfate transporter family protein [Hydromonas duriensis]TDR30184.1 hypothetical protein DFR44_1258 [Hydromonas duriensis]